MFKLILLNHNLESIKILCNCILNEIPDVQLSGFTTNMEEFDNLATKVKPHIIMMNYSDYRHSKYCKKSEYNNLKIIFCSSLKTTKISPKQVLIAKNANLTQIKKSIAEFVSTENTRLMREKIIRWLESFEFNFKLIGTTYLLEAILYCYENKSDYVFENLEQNVYPQVAEICHTNLPHVKWSIARSILNMNTHISASAKKQLSETLKFDCSVKFTPKTLISIIVTKLN